MYGVKKSLARQDLSELAVGGHCVPVAASLEEESDATRRSRWASVRQNLGLLRMAQRLAQREEAAQS